MYTLNHQGETFGFPNDAIEAAASLTFSQELVTIAPKQSKQIRVSANSPEGLESKRLALQSGWITVNGSGNSLLSLPFQGLAGSLRSSPVLQGLSLGYVGNLSSPTPANDTFSFNISCPSKSLEGRQVRVKTELEVGSWLVRFTLLPLSGDQRDPLAPGLRSSVYEPLSDAHEWVPRKTLKLRWDGQSTKHSDGPKTYSTVTQPGVYKSRVEALRLSGNPDALGDFEVAESSPFRIINGRPKAARRSAAISDTLNRTRTMPAFSVNADQQFCKSKEYLRELGGAARNMAEARRADEEDRARTYAPFALQLAASIVEQCFSQGQWEETLAGLLGN